jgi:hypothetical protein
MSKVHTNINQTNESGSNSPAQEPKLCNVSFETIPESAQEDGKRFVPDEETRKVLEIQGSSREDRSKLIGALRALKHKKTLASANDRHFIIFHMEDENKLRELFGKVLTHVSPTENVIRDRFVGKTVFIPVDGEGKIFNVFPDFNTRKRLSNFQGLSVIFPSGKTPFYFKRSRTEEDVELPSPDTWILLFEMKTCYFFSNCAKVFYERYGFPLGGFRSYSVLKQYAPRNGLPSTVLVARDKDDKRFLEQEIMVALLLALGYRIKPGKQVGEKVLVSKIVEFFITPLQDEVDIDETFEAIANALQQRERKEVEDKAARRTAALNALAGITTCNSFTALGEDVNTQGEQGSSRSAQPTVDTRPGSRGYKDNFPGKSSPTPSLFGVWTEKSS